MKCPSCGIESEGCVYCPECGLQLMYDSAKSADQTQNQQGTPPPPNAYAHQWAQGAYPPPQPVYQVNQYYNFSSHKSRLMTLLLAIFLGYWGVHRFYAGKVGTGLLWIFTFGMFGIGYIIDIILIACGTFKDSNGMLIDRW